MRFSERTGWDLRQNELTRLLQEKRQNGDAVVDLTVSNPTLVGLEYPVEVGAALRRAVGEAYRPEAMGLLAAREAVCGYYAEKGSAVGVDDVLLCASTSEAYAFLFKTLADPGDEVLVPRPSYPLFGYLAGLENVVPRAYPLRWTEVGWRVDLDRLAAAVSERTRAVVLVSPNNPTGSCVTDEERRTLEALARECGFCLVVDEVFGDYQLDSSAERVPTFAVGAEAPTVVLSGLSKVLGLPQAKLSWMVLAGEEAFKVQARARLEVVADTFLSVGGAVQAALPALLETRAVVQGAITARLRQSLAVIKQGLAGCVGLRILPVEGGWYAVLEVEGGSEALALRLLREHGVLLHPGHFYDFATERYLVVGLLGDLETVKKGVAWVGAVCVGG